MAWRDRFNPKPDPDTRTDKEVADDARAALASLKRDLHRLQERGYRTRLLVQSPSGNDWKVDTVDTLTIIKSKTETISL